MPIILAIWETEIEGIRVQGQPRQITQETQSPKNNHSSQALVAHTCNRSYSRGRNQEDCSSKPAQANSSQDPISKIPTQKRAKGAAEEVERLSSKCKPRVKTPVLPKRNNNSNNKITIAKCTGGTYGSSIRAPALQVQNSEFKPLSHTHTYTHTKIKTGMSPKTFQRSGVGSGLWYLKRIVQGRGRVKEIDLDT
jgi:hypothetical protein